MQSTETPVYSLYSTPVLFTTVYNLPFTKTDNRMEITLFSCTCVNRDNAMGYKHKYKLNQLAVHWNTHTCTLYVLMLVSPVWASPYWPTCVILSCVIHRITGPVLYSSVFFLTEEWEYNLTPTLLISNLLAAPLQVRDQQQDSTGTSNKITKPYENLSTEGFHILRCKRCFEPPGYKVWCITVYKEQKISGNKNKLPQKLKLTSNVFISEKAQGDRKSRSTEVVASVE